MKLDEISIVTREECDDEPILMLREITDEISEHLLSDGTKESKRHAENLRTVRDSCWEAYKTIESDIRQVAEETACRYYNGAEQSNDVDKLNWAWCIPNEAWNKMIIIIRKSVPVMFRNAIIDRIEENWKILDEEYDKFRKLKPKM